MTDGLRPWLCPGVRRRIARIELARFGLLSDREHADATTSRHPGQLGTRWSPLVRVAARLLPASKAIALMLVEHTREMDDRQALVGPSRHFRNRVN
jgi:hypothetical protein